MWRRHAKRLSGGVGERRVPLVCRWRANAPAAGGTLFNLEKTVAVPKPKPLAEKLVELVIIQAVFFLIASPLALLGWALIDGDMPKATWLGAAVAGLGFWLDLTD